MFHARIWRLDILLRKKVRIASGIESLPIQHKLKQGFKYFVCNSLVNNGISKKLYLKYREHDPVNIDELNVEGQSQVSIESITSHTGGCFVCLDQEHN